MKFRPLIILFTILLFLISINVGCQRELEAMDVLSKTMDTVTETNSLVYTIDSRQEIIIPRFYYLTASYNISGALVKEPMTAEIDIQLEMTGIQTEVKIFMANNQIYTLIPGIGWSQQNSETDLYLVDSYSDPFRYSKILHDTGTDALRMEMKGDYYLLSYEDHSEPFFDLITNEIQTRYFDDFLENDQFDDHFGEITIVDFSYFSLVDGTAFLPLKDVISYKVLIEILDQPITIDHLITINYLEFDTIDTLAIPSELEDKLKSNR